MEEALNMKNGEVDKLRTIRYILEGKLKWLDGARILKLSERQIGRLCARVRKEGNRGILHGLRAAVQQPPR